MNGKKKKELLALKVPLKYHIHYLLLINQTPLQTLTYQTIIIFPKVQTYFHHILIQYFSDSSDRKVLVTCTSWSESYPHNKLEEQRDNVNQMLSLELKNIHNMHSCKHSATQTIFKYKVQQIGFLSYI